IVLLPQVHLPIRDNQWSPGRKRAGIDLEAGNLLVGGWSRFRQSYGSGFAEKIQLAVGECDRTFAHAAVSPGDIAGLEFHRGQDRVGEPVEIIAYQNRRAVV